MMFLSWWWQSCFILTYLKKSCQKILRSKNFKQKKTHQVVEAEALRVEAEAIHKSPLPHLCFKYTGNVILWPVHWCSASVNLKLKLETIT